MHYRLQKLLFEKNIKIKCENIEKNLDNCLKEFKNDDYMCKFKSQEFKLCIENFVNNWKNKNKNYNLKIES